MAIPFTGRVRAHDPHDKRTPSFRYSNTTAVNQNFSPTSTPLAETENLDVYPAAPEGFNVARENIPHGEVKVVEYDSKTLGLRRMLRVYTPPGYTPDQKLPVLGR